METAISELAAALRDLRTDLKRVGAALVLLLLAALAANKQTA